MATKLITLEERHWIASNAVIQMGSKVKYPVMDIDKAIERIREQRGANKMSPWIEIQPISEDLHKAPNRMATFQKDPVTGVYYGIAIDADEFGNIRWQKIQLHDHLSLNMDRRDDAKIWAVLRFHPDILGSPWAYQTPYYKIFDPVDTAREEQVEIDGIKKAFERVDKLLEDPKHMVFFARYLGEELVENSNYELVKAALLRHAKNHSASFNRKWDNRLRSYGEHFESARALGIITDDVDRGFVFKNISLGTTSEEAIKMLSQDANIMNSINNDLAEKDVVISYISKEIKTKKNSPLKTEKVTENGSGSESDFE